MQNQNYEEQAEVYEKPQAMGHLFFEDDVICTSGGTSPEPPANLGDED